MCMTSVQMRTAQLCFDASIETAHTVLSATAAVLMLGREPRRSCTTCLLDSGSTLHGLSLTLQGAQASYTMTAHSEEACPSHLGYLCFQNRDLCKQQLMSVVFRGMRWSSEREEVSAIDTEMYRDHFDGSHWQEDFCEDPLIAAKGGPDKNVGLEFCADGVSPFGRKSYSMWFGALSIMNLPPALRHCVDTMHLCFIVPGPHKPVSYLPCHCMLQLPKHDC